MFDTIFVRPIFNVLTFIYGIIPGHDFGLALIVFTIVIRLIMWPLVKKQLNHTKKLRALQPDLKRIKQQTKGDKQKEAALTMALYKEKEINPLAPIGLLIVQLPILFALYAGISKIVRDPQTVVDFSYSWVRDLSWMKEVASDISKFDNSLFGAVDLTRKAIGDSNFYWPALAIVILSCATQYFTSKQLSITDKDAKSLRQLLKDAGKGGEQAEQAEISAAVGKLMRFIIPVMVFVFSVTFAAALSLYWLISGLVAYVQQSIILRDDQVKLEAEVDKVKVTAEIIEKPQRKKSARKKVPARKKRRR